jgi:hypothetical protein
VGSIQPRSHAFVIRVWLERAEEEEVWRGYITHLETEARHHFVELSEIARFIGEHLQHGEPT